MENVQVCKNRGAWWDIVHGGGHKNVKWDLATEQQHKTRQRLEMASFAYVTEVCGLIGPE